MEFNGINIEWLGHASFCLNKTIYIDPFQVKGGKADLILITHAHYDHCSLEDIKKLIHKDTIVIGPVDIQSKIAKLGDLKFHIISPSATIEVGKIKITGYPAYNLNKHFHPKSEGWLGYLIEINKIKFYHCGDTDAIPELKEIKTDVLMIPIGGTYTMNAEEAATITNIILPKVAIPMHFGSIIGTSEDAKKFKQLCRVPVTICENTGNV